MSRLEDVIEHGNRFNIIVTGPDGRMTVDEAIAVRADRERMSTIKCRDGFSLSVIAGWGTYCDPRPDYEPNLIGNAPPTYEGPFTMVEVGYPSRKPRPWRRWRKFAEDPKSPTGTVYAYVPVEMVRKLVARHGGEA